MLEHQAFEKGLSLQIKPKQTTEFYEQESITPPQQVRVCLSLLITSSLLVTPRFKYCFQMISNDNTVKLHF